MINILNLMYKIPQNKNNLSSAETQTNVYFYLFTYGVISEINIKYFYVKLFISFKSKKFKVVSQTINSLLIKLIKISFRNQTNINL